ncbi:transporter substrate-binding domain-containing protein [Nocardioides sp.]|uniref:transporter substrate-binding domain-containing protein n=1 Tax=Nocardioides sp. TaxID=35761 RepID=UPI002B2713A2|nr:transporter substrate-binding domain-containing protein [Nocardioides sp.]
MRPFPLLAALCALLSVVLGGCADGSSAATAQRTLVIGIGDDVPGFSTLDEAGAPVGFDVDVAHYLARGLGWSAEETEFRPLPDSTRERSLQSGEVDLVVSTYPATAHSDRLVDLAGPYLTARQDLLVAADEAGITGPHTLAGRRLCSVVDTPDAAVLQQPAFSPGVALRPAESLAACVDLLLGGEVDAVTGDDVMLDGYTQRYDGLKVLESPFGVRSYGIGLPKGSPDGAVVEELLRRMIESGAWDDSYREHLLTPGATVPEPPAPGSALLR